MQKYEYYKSDKYDKALKHKSKELKYLSKKEFKNEEQVEVIGELVLKNTSKEPIGTITLFEQEYKVLDKYSYNSLFYGIKGYIQVGEKEYIAILKFRILIWIILGLLIIGLGLNTTTSDDEPGVFHPKDEIINEINIEDYENSMVKVVIPSNGSQSDIIIKQPIMKDDKEIIYDGDINIKIDLIENNKSSLIFERTVEMVEGRIPSFKLDYKKLKLKPGKYKGLMTITFDDGTKEEIDVDIIVVNEASVPGYEKELNPENTDEKLEIIFENLRVLEGSVNGTQEINNTNGRSTSIYYNATLAIPGDQYSFIVDIVNVGNIDAMIKDIVATKLTDEEDKYLNYSVEYLDGQTISSYDKLAVGKRVTIKVFIEFDKNLENTDLPSENIRINKSVDIRYVRSTKLAVDRGNTR